MTTKLFCGKCGTMMAGESGRSHTGTVHCYYKCGTRKRGGKEACSLKPVRKEPLEQFVVKTALEKVLNDRVIDLLADKLLEYQSKENTRLPVLQAELKEVKRRIDNLVAAIGADREAAHHTGADFVLVRSVPPRRPGGYRFSGEGHRLFCQLHLSVR